MVSRSEPPLPEHPHHPGGHQARSPRRQRDDREAERAQAGPHHIPPGPGNGQGDRRSQVPRMFGPHSEGAQKRVRRGNPRRSVPTAQAQKEEALLSALMAAIALFRFCNVL